MTGIKETLQDIFSLNAPNMLLLQKTLADKGVDELKINSITSKVQELCEDRKFDHQMISEVLAQNDLSGDLADIVIDQQEKFPDFGTIYSF